MKNLPHYPSPEEALFVLLNRCASNLQKAAEEGMKNAGLSVAEYTMLRIVENTPGITAGEAKARLYATAPAVAQLVAKLEGRGLLQRDSDRTDARRLQLRLTRAGAKQLQNAKKSVAQLVRALKLPHGLVESLLNNLSTFSSSLSAYGSR
jgi:DNA-binding MarR family transcriptional regulator